ncbi:hypothetical protein [Paenibacillus radicis (ex Xue et al. 2023)]|uniref:DUF975 family protein n=1 Tax=Paenibacillus radicis (ex Xue et al. 2023) TaxID=2972489 RepID=A0ABT1YSK7_9BACL|nr:hypothetical protein [Paenibacillus radicis (ex Xue et al. 2023)]MCR8636172.1 hypothetical protein [Paenibacillus radicis (ex Xue et al. 2023)]
MLKTMKTGWTMAWHQPFAVCALFIYNLIWGLVLYSMIRSVVVPLLHRYPGNDLSREAVQLFWVEGQFQIMKTDLIQYYLWWGCALLAARMLLSPLLNAGIYYSVEHTEMNAGYRFVQGMQKLGLPFLGLYILQILLSAAPLYLLVPKVLDGYNKHLTLESLAWNILPLIGGYLLYLFLLQTVFMYVQFGKLNGKSSAHSLRLLLRNTLPVLLLAFTLLLITVAISAAVMTSAMIWAGFAAVAGVQAYRFIHMFCKMWAITSQYALWNAKEE